MDAMAQGSGDDPYRVLGVDDAADDDAIDTAYRAMARRFHPDLAGETSTIQMTRINLAFDAIRTADRRAALAGVDGRVTGVGAAEARSPSGPSSTGNARSRRRWRSANDGTGGAGPPPGRPSGSVLDFGRHLGWSIGEIARVDPGYLDWLGQRREGQPYLDEIERTLRRVRYRLEPDPVTPVKGRRGVFGSR
jgi:curved DNA-binding protein CbpA